LVQRTGGVPFFVTSCAQALADLARSDAPDAEAWDAAVPWTVTQSVQQRVAALAPETKEVLQTAAVVGREVTVGLLARVAARDEQGLLDALDAAQRLRLLEDTGTGGYRFAHDLVREALEGGLSSARRALVHRWVAEALEATVPRPIDALAFHYARSDAVEKAIEYLELAGDHALAQRAHAAAGDYYEALVVSLDGLQRPLAAARAREKRAATLRLQADYPAARDELERAARVYQAAGDENAVARTAAHIGEVCRDVGERLEGVARLRRALESIDQTVPSHGLAELYVVLASLLSAGGQFPEQLMIAERAQELSTRIGDERTELLAAAQRGHALQQTGQSRAARQVLTEALARVEQDGSPEPLLSILITLTDLLIWTGEFGAARQHAQRALTVARATGEPGNVAFKTWVAALPVFLRGEWAAARTGFEEAIALYRALGPSWGLSYALCCAGWLALVQGRWEDGRRLLDEAIALAEGTVNLKVQRIGQGLRAELDILEGAPDTARARLSDLLDHGGVEEVDVTAILPALAWAELEVGALAAARGTVAQAVRRARDQDWRLALVEAWRVQALVSLREGKTAEAESVLQEGLVLARAMEYPYAEGRLEHLAGVLCRQTGQLAAAAAHLDRARSLFAGLGARADATRVDHDLRALARSRGQGLALE
jgi:tetratricopeptide (TPR) repeat protein